MFIDFLTLMLVNMSAGLFALACYGFCALDKPDRHHWASVFGAVGVIASICGFYIIFNFPLVGPYNQIFGELSVILGILFVAAAWSVAKGWPLAPLGIYALFAGMVAVLIGAAIISKGLTKSPALSGAGFIFTGLAGITLGPVLWWRWLRWLRWIVGLELIAASMIWLATGMGAYLQHIDAYKTWVPAVMQQLAK